MNLRAAMPLLQAAITRLPAAGGNGIFTKDKGIDSLEFFFYRGFLFFKIIVILNVDPEFRRIAEEFGKP